MNVSEGAYVRFVEETARERPDGREGRPPLVGERARPWEEPVSAGSGSAG
jgi:hypothetical protein